MHDLFFAKQSLKAFMRRYFGIVWVEMHKYEYDK